MTIPTPEALALAERIYKDLMFTANPVQEIATEITRLGEKLITEFASRVEIMVGDEKNRTFLINWMRSSFTLSDSVVERIGRAWMHKLGLDPDNPRVPPRAQSGGEIITKKDPDDTDWKATAELRQAQINQLRAALTGGLAGDKYTVRMYRNRDGLVFAVVDRHEHFEIAPDTVSLGSAIITLPTPPADGENQ